MKIENMDERVHLIQDESNTSNAVWSVIKDITKLQEDAFYICDVGDIVRKYRIWKMKLPRVQPYYAVKCNDSAIVLELLAALGTGFDCASKNEINKILNLGIIDTNRIVFANPAKPSSHIRYAASMGVSMMTFDNEMELHKIKQLYPDAKLIIRIRCDDTNAQCQLGMKFGCDPLTEAPDLLKLAFALNLNVIGCSFHVGSGCRNPTIFGHAIETAANLFNYVNIEFGYKFYLLDIGGGYPGDRGTDISKIADIINTSLDKYFSDQSIQIIAEPGRFFVSSAYTLACNIHSIRDVINKDTNTIHKMYYINDGVYGSFNCVLYDHQHVIAQPLSISDNDTSRKYYSTSIWGPTCDGLDQVINDVMLPEMNLGDWFVFENMGAYTLPVASPFNGFPVPKVHIVANECVWILLQNMITLNDDHFYIGTNKTPYRSSTDKDILNFHNNDLERPILPIRLQLPVCNGNASDEHVLEFVEHNDE